MLKSVRSDRVEFTFQKAVKTRQGVTKKGGTSETSAEGTTHSYSDAEKVGFVGEDNVQGSHNFFMQPECNFGGHVLC